MVLFALYQAAIIYGVVIGVLALGFHLTHKTTGYMNLGYTVNLGVGMGIGFITTQLLNLTPILGAPSAFLFCGLFNAAVYLLFYRRMESIGYSEALVSLFGLVSLFLAEQVLMVTEYWMRVNLVSNRWCGPFYEWGFYIPHFHYFTPNIGVFRGGTIEITLTFIIILVASWWYYNHENSITLRAVSENAQLAEICGVDSIKTKAVTWFIAGGLGGIAGVILPFMTKGEMGRDVWLVFTPVVATAILVEKREIWVAGLVGLLVGFFHIYLLNVGQSLIGVWVGEYWNVIDVIFLVVVLMIKDRKIRLPTWVNPRRL